MYASFQLPVYCVSGCGYLVVMCILAYFDNLSLRVASQCVEYISWRVIVTSVSRVIDNFHRQMWRKWP